MGLRGVGWGGGGSFLFNRLRGVLRVCHELVLGPLLVFDLSLLRKKRSVKELLSRTEIVNGPMLPRLLCAIIFVPLMVGLALASNFISQWEYRQGLTVTKFNLPSITGKGANGIDKAPFFELTSNTFQVSSFPDVDERRLLFLFGHDISSKHKKKIFRPRLALFSRKLKQRAVFKVYSPNILYQILSDAFAGNPFIANGYPMLSTLLSRPRSFYRPADSLEQQKTFSPQEVAQAQQLLQDALSLNANQFINQVMALDLRFNGLLKLRKALTDRFELTPKAQFQWAQLNDHLFLRVSSHHTHSLQGRLVKVYLIPVDTFNGPIYELSYPGRDQGVVVGLTLLQHLFDEGRFYFDERTPVSPPSEDTSLEDINFGQCIDYLLNSQMTYEQVDPVYRRYLQYVTTAVDFYFQSDDRKSQGQAERKFLAGELSSLVEMDRLLSKRYPQWATFFSGKGFQTQLDRLNDDSGG